MWYVVRCQSGQEEMITHSCRKHLSSDVLDEVFSFRCERLWRSEGIWKPVEKELFPGYVFLESRRPKQLSKELEQYRRFLTVLEEPGYLISVYENEEQYLRKLCGNHHFLKMSYGYRDRENGRDCITEGPLKNLEKQILRVDWHRRFAQVEFFVAGKKSVVWAGIGLDKNRIAETGMEKGQTIPVL